MKALKFLTLLVLIPLLLGACNGMNVDSPKKLSASPALDRIVSRGELMSELPATCRRLT